MAGCFGNEPIVALAYFGSFSTSGYWVWTNEIKSAFVTGADSCFNDKASVSAAAYWTRRPVEIVRLRSPLYSQRQTTQYFIRFYYGTLLCCWSSVRNAIVKAVTKQTDVFKTGDIRLYVHWTALLLLPSLRTVIVNKWEEAVSDVRLRGYLLVSGNFGRRKRHNSSEGD